MSGNDSYKRWHKPVKNNFTESGKLRSGQTHQGYYNPVNKEKYIGDSSLIIYRSAWEYSFCKWCDHTPSVIKWSSEPVKVPYYDRVSKLEECKKLGLNPNNPANWVRKNYNIDFWVEVKKSDESVVKWLVEIKPKRKLFKPKSISKESTIRDVTKYNNAMKEYLINESKFEAAREFAKRSNSEFWVFTEDNLRKLGIIGGRFDLKPINK